MRDPRDLYELDEGYGLDVDRAEHAPVLIHALEGGMDAGHAGALVASHLLETLKSERVATFDVDELVDFRSRRPPMVFSRLSFTDYEEPEIALDLLHDDEGTPVLLLHGPEPDLQWHRFVAAVVGLVEELGVRTTIGVHGVPMAVPHTRPTTITVHASRGDLIEPQRGIMGTFQVPGTVAGLLELRVGQAGHDAVGYSANVPHYLAQADYPQAAAELVRRISRTAGLALPVGDLEAAAAETARQIDEQVTASAEVSAVVRALEQQYDAFVGGAVQGHGTLLAEPGDLPTADEIGAELEAFLAERTDRDEDGGPQG